MDSFIKIRKQRTSPWRTGFFVIEAMVTGGLVANMDVGTELQVCARQKPLTKSTNYPVRPERYLCFKES